MATKAILMNEFLIGRKFRFVITDKCYSSRNEDAVGTQMNLEMHSDLFMVRKEWEIASILEQCLKVSNNNIRIVGVVEVSFAFSKCS